AEEAGQGVVIAAGDRVELVIVTAGAGYGQAEEGLGHHVDLIVDAADLFLTNVHRRMDALAQVEEPGREDRLVESLDGVPARVIEQITGEVLDQESVVGEVRIERADDVIAIAVGVRDVVVELVAGGLGVADEIEPVAGPSLAVSRAGQEALDQ